MIDLNGDGYIDIKEFVHGFFKVYYSNLQSKIKFTFDMYDFDKDGYILKEDVRLILSHIPIRWLFRFWIQDSFLSLLDQLGDKREVRFRKHAILHAWAMWRHQRILLAH